MSFVCAVWLLYHALSHLIHGTRWPFASHDSINKLFERDLQVACEWSWKHSWITGHTKMYPQHPSQDALHAYSWTNNPPFQFYSKIANSGLARKRHCQLLIGIFDTILNRCNMQEPLPDKLHATNQTCKYACDTRNGEKTGSHPASPSPLSIKWNNVWPQ